MRVSLSLQDGRQKQRQALRDQVLDAAATIIAKDGVEAFSMRKLARSLHCAPMSLYSYFTDKHDLLLALAHRSFDALAKRLAKASSSSPLEALRVLFLEYARFGFDNPDEYRILFMTPEAQPPRMPKTPKEILADNPAFALGVERARECVEAQTLIGDPHAIATLLWTAVHGAVAAILCFPAFPFGDPGAYVAQVVDLILVGLKARSLTVPT